MMGTFDIGYWGWVTLVLGMIGSVVIGIGAGIVALYRNREKRDGS